METPEQLLEAYRQRNLLSINIHRTLQFRNKYVDTHPEFARHNFIIEEFQEQIGVLESLFDFSEFTQKVYLEVSVNNFDSDGNPLKLDTSKMYVGFVDSDSKLPCIVLEKENEMFETGDCVLLKMSTKAQIEAKFNPNVVRKVCANCTHSESKEPLLGNYDEHNLKLTRKYCNPCVGYSNFEYKSKYK